MILDWIGTWSRDRDTLQSTSWTISDGLIVSHETQSGRNRRLIGHMAPHATIADLLKRLGDIPPERVRLHPTPGTATEKDLLKVVDREKSAMRAG